MKKSLLLLFLAAFSFLLISCSGDNGETETPSEEEVFLGGEDLGLQGTWVSEYGFEIKGQPYTMTMNFDIEYEAGPQLFQVCCQCLIRMARMRILVPLL